MQIYKASQKGALPAPSAIDPNDATPIKVFWGAPTFTASQVYRDGDIVRPAVDNGYYFECIINGISGDAEPIWVLPETTTTTTTHCCCNDDTQEPLLKTTSGTAIFKAIPYDLWLLPTETITSSAWFISNVEPVGATITTPITLSNSQIIGNVATYIRIDLIPSAVKKFWVSNQATKDNGEKLTRSFSLKTWDQAI